MTERVSPFATLKEAPAFQVKTKTTPVVAAEAVEQIAEDNNFVSRQPRREPKASRAPKREPNTYRTGRNCNLNLKATKDTIDRYHRLANDKGITRARLLEMALDALEAPNTKTLHRTE